MDGSLFEGFHGVARGFMRGVEEFSFIILAESEI